jgi:hypothetical protein
MTLETAASIGDDAIVGSPASTADTGPAGNHAGHRQRHHAVGHDPIFYMASSGCAWPLLPCLFPPVSTVRS